MGTDAYRISWYICAAATLPFIVMRLWFRWRRVGKLSIDDYLVLLALGCFCGELVTQQIMWDNGMGGNMSKLTAAQVEGMNKAIVPGVTMYITTLWCIKFALVFFYRSIAVPGSYMVSMYNAALIGLAITYAILFFDVIFHCYPNSRRWSHDPNKRCDKKAVEINYWLTSLLNILSDFVIICLPITMVSRLQMALKEKLALIAIFALGFFVIIASCMRAYFAKQNHQLLTVTASSIEASVSLIAVCLPAVRSLLFGKSINNSGSNYGRHYELSGSRRQGNLTNSNTPNFRSGNRAASSGVGQLQLRHHATGSEDSLVYDEGLGISGLIIPEKAITADSHVVSVSEDSKSDVQSTEVKSPFV